MNKKIQMMRQEYNRSICSTCSFLSVCALTTNKSNISSCSEYEHYTDAKREKFRIDIGRSSQPSRQIRNKRQLVLN